MRLVIVQYAGDYREAVQRFDAGGAETYYAQKYSVEAVADLGRQLEAVTVLCCLTAEPYEQQLSNGVRAIGAGFQQRLDERVLLQLIQAQRPTHLVLRTPIAAVFRWAIRHRVAAIATLADSFATTGLRQRWRNHQLCQLLNHPQIEWIGNHGITASGSLHQIGVNPSKIIPWDWPAMVTPAAFGPKQLSLQSAYQLVYVGAMTAAKGLGDVLQAIAHLKAQGLTLQLTVAGAGEIAEFERQAQALAIAPQVKFLGLIPHATIVPLMQAADIVVIPSRHDYPEGFPMTIYEALCARTPIIASDHPMFRQQLQHQVNALIFPAANSGALAQTIQTLLSEPALYAKLSAMAPTTWEKLQLPVKWADLIKRWLNASPENQQWLAAHSLAAKL